MANDTIVTIRGFAGSAVTLYNNNDGSRTATVNVGVTSSYFSPTSQSYEEGQTVWYSLRARGSLATNMAASVKTGTPLLARGKLTERTWVGDNGQTNTRLTLAVDSVGIDLNTGEAHFVRVKQPKVASDGATVSGGVAGSGAGTGSGGAGNGESKSAGVFEAGKAGGSSGAGSAMSSQAAAEEGGDQPPFDGNAVVCRNEWEHFDDKVPA